MSGKKQEDKPVRGHQSEGDYEAEDDGSDEDIPDDGTYYHMQVCLLYTSPSPRDLSTSRMPSSA